MTADGAQKELADRAEQRAWMVLQQIATRGLTDHRVLEAMSEVPREEFVPEAFQHAAYDDCPLPIGYGQTISQPFTVAFMCEATELTGTESVLEIGTGSGYAACVLSCLAREVHTVERIPELAQEAQKRIERLGYDNVHVYVADGTLGLAEQSPFDGIVVTAGAPALPQGYVDQLAEGGRIVMPIGNRFSQSMCRFTKRRGELHREDLGAFAFVPLIGTNGWDESEDY